MSWQRTEGRWGPSAGPPPGSCSSPGSGGWACSAGTVRPGPLGLRLSANLHFHSQRSLGRCTQQGLIKETPPPPPCKLWKKDKTFEGQLSQLTVYVFSPTAWHSNCFFSEVKLGTKWHLKYRLKKKTKKHGTPRDCVRSKCKAAR